MVTLKTDKSAQSRCILLFEYVFIYILSLGCGGALSGCDDSQPRRAQLSMPLLYDIEGPRGIVRERGPWLVRVGAPSGADPSRYQIRTQVVSSSNDVPADDNEAGERGGARDNEDIAGELAYEITEVDSEIISIPLVMSGRPDILFGVLPEVAVDTSVLYSLTRDQEEVVPPERFSYVGTLDGESTEMTAPERSCVVVLNAPNATRPVAVTDDRAPEAGIQIVYDLSVYLMEGDALDIETSTTLAGVVTLDWLTTTSNAAPAPNTLLSLRGGRARSHPFLTPLGAQRLRVRALTTRGARCEETFEFMSAQD